MQGKVVIGDLLLRVGMILQEARQVLEGSVMPIGGGQRHVDQAGYPVGEQVLVLVGHLPAAIVLLVGLFAAAKLGYAGIVEVFIGIEAASMAARAAEPTVGLALQEEHGALLGVSADGRAIAGYIGAPGRIDEDHAHFVSRNGRLHILVGNQGAGAALGLTKSLLEQAQPGGRARRREAARIGQPLQAADQQGPELFIEREFRVQEVPHFVGRGRGKA